MVIGSVEIQAIYHASNASFSGVHVITSCLGAQSTNLVECDTALIYLSAHFVSFKKVAVVSRYPSEPDWPYNP
jgi:hypothetical protein